MIEQIWPDRFVEDGNLTRNISTLRKDSALAPERFDWWMTSLSEESATRTKAFEHFYRHWWPDRGDPLHSAAFTQMQITGIGNHTPHAWVPGENAIIFSAKVGDSINLWKIGVSPRTGQVNAPPTRHLRNGMGSSTIDRLRQHNGLLEPYFKR